MKTPLGTEVDLGPGHIVLDWVPAPAKGAQQHPSFRPMSIVATVAHAELNCYCGQTAGCIEMPLDMNPSAQATLC